MSLWRRPPPLLFTSSPVKADHHSVMQILWYVLSREHSVVLLNLICFTYILLKFSIVNAFSAFFVKFQQTNSLIFLQSPTPTAESKSKTQKYLKMSNVYSSYTLTWWYPVRNQSWQVFYLIYREAIPVLLHHPMSALFFSWEAREKHPCCGFGSFPREQGELVQRCMISPAFNHHVIRRQLWLGAA